MKYGSLADRWAGTCPFVDVESCCVDLPDSQPAGIVTHKDFDVTGSVWHESLIIFCHLWFAQMRCLF